MKRYTPRQIQRTLGKYATVETALELCGRTWALTCVRDPYELLDRLIEQEERRIRVERFPYWAEIWPASIGLAQWLWEDLQGTRSEILELGCGVGGVGVVLAGVGHRVTATDYVEDALILAQHNAMGNGAGTRHQVSYLDWRHPVGRPVPLIVASDVAYEKKNHPFLVRTLRALLAPGGRFVLSDPRRPVCRWLVAALCEQGYAYQGHAVEVQWKSSRHHIDVHCFWGPAAGRSPTRAEGRTNGPSTV